MYLAYSRDEPAKNILDRMTTIGKGFHHIINHIAIWIHIKLQYITE